MSKRSEVLEISLGDILVGYLSHARDGKNIFVFDDNYIALGSSRPRLSLFFKDENFLKKSWVGNQVLPSFFSNLLPEGDFRHYIARQLNIKDQNEFSLFKALSRDCPGNIIVKFQDETIASELSQNKTNLPSTGMNNILQFLLAGVQLKFSMLLREGKYTLDHLNQPGNFIIKMPSPLYPCLPENEYSMMHLAASVGVDIPEIRLVSIKEIPTLAHLSNINSQYVYVIKRYDRTETGNRIHCEDFAQVLGVRPNEKYTATNYDTVARIIKDIFTNSMAQLEQFLNRIFVNILLGNTDAHLKNWSLRYPDGITPELAPAYDIVSTLEYIPANLELALNMAKVKQFYAINEMLLRSFARRIQVDEGFVLDIARKVVKKADEKWPELMHSLPITPANRAALMQHWLRLKSPFIMPSFIK